MSCYINSQSTSWVLQLNEDLNRLWISCNLDDFSNDFVVTNRNRKDSTTKKRKTKVQKKKDRKKPKQESVAKMPAEPMENVIDLSKEDEVREYEDLFADDDSSDDENSTFDITADVVMEFSESQKYLIKMYESKYKRSEEGNIKLTTYQEMNDMDSWYKDGCVRSFINRDIIFPAFCHKKTKKKIIEIYKQMFRNS